MMKTRIPNLNKFDVKDGNSLKRVEMIEVYRKNKNRNVKEYPMILTVHEVAEILQIGVRTAYKVMDQEDFPLFRIGKSKRVRREDFFDWIKKQGR